MRSKVLTGLGVFLACALPALANPVVGQPGSLFLGPIALIAEAFIVAKLLAGRGFNYRKTFGAWLLINLVTCGLMNLALFWLGVDAYHGGILVVLTPILIFQAAVILIEAGIIMWMSKGKRYRDSGLPLTWGRAFVISLIGNLVSFGISFLALLIPVGGGPPFPRRR